MSLKNEFLDKKNFVLYFLIIFIIASAFYFYIEGRSNSLSETFNREGHAFILFAIYDENNDDRPLLSSLFIYNNTTKRSAVFDIPGNIGYIFRNLNKVDSLHSGFDPSKPDLYLDTVKDLFQLEERPFYIFFSLENIRFWIDLISGIEVFNVNNISLTLADGEVVNIPAGSVVLDGDTAVQFLQIEAQDESSNSWVERRQKFMQAFLSKIGRESELLQNRYAFPTVKSKMQTNFDSIALKIFFKELNLFNADNIIKKNITGSLRIVSDQRLMFPYYEGRVIKESTTQVVSLISTTQSTGADAWMRKIEIKNGTERNGLAAQAQRKFESMGFSVASIGNAPTKDVVYTVVLDLSGNIEAARRVADVIRCTRVYTVAQTSEESSESLADIQVILGRDFDGQYVKQLDLE